MNVDGSLGLTFDNTYVRDLEGLYRPWNPAPVPSPAPVIVNDALAQELGVDPRALTSPAGVAVLSGNSVPHGAEPIAQAYAGHQFGNYSPVLGDGRAVLLGEVVDIHGRRRDIHLKGAGRTPYARGGDGKAALGPMLREYVIGEAMHALGIPTTRALAVVTTGETIARDRMLPGAVLTRVASSHLRVGTFQLTAQLDSPELLVRLADYAINRHYPEVRDRPNPYLALYECVVEAQASLVAKWMLVGFIHGVMNTDNMTISGETIDYGPCAFMDQFDPATVFSSIDHHGRYAYAQQPRIAQWNLGRLAESLLPLIDTDSDTAVALATDTLRSFTDRFNAHWGRGMRAKLGLVVDSDVDDTELVNELHEILHTNHIDYTSFFRALAEQVLGDRDAARNLFVDVAVYDAWSAKWTDRLAREGRGAADIAASMNRVNPVYIPRNHKVEEALAAANDNDLAPLTRLVDALSEPFTKRDGLDEFESPAPDGWEGYVTFCGT